MHDTSQPIDRQSRWRLLSLTTQRALHRGGIREDRDVAALSDRELLRLAGIGPSALQDIRKHFPTHGDHQSIMSAQ